MPGLFFTGTDTGVGKTFVTAAVARLLRSQGREVGVSKPVATGASRLDDRWLAEDTVRLAEAMRVLAVKHGPAAVRHCIRLVESLRTLLDEATGTGEMMNDE